MKALLMLLFFVISSSISSSKEQIDLQWIPPNLVIKVDTGFHVNHEAPAKISFQNQDSPLRPLSLKKQELIFELGSAENLPFKVSFYICDDQNTSCKLFKSTYALKDGKILEINPSEEATKNEKKERPRQYNAHQFIVDNFEEALKLANVENKLLLVDFAAPWCPACVRLETEVFPKKQFQKIARNLIKASLNADLEINKEVFKKYDVNLLPTIILMNSKGEEIHRMIDYKPLRNFNHDLQSALTKAKPTTESLTQKALQNDKMAIEALAMRAMNMNHFTEALKWYELLGKESLEKAVSKIAVLSENYEKDKKNEADYIKELKMAISAYPGSYEALDWRLTLAEIDKKNAADVLKENSSLLTKTINNKKLAQNMFEKTTAGTISFPQLEVRLYLFKTYEKLGANELKEQSLKDLQDEIKKIKTISSRPGELLQIIQYQREAQMPEEEQSLKSLVLTSPNNHVYHMKLGNYYFRHKKYSEALPELILSTKLEHPLSLSNLTLLAKTQKELKLKEELKKTIELANSLFLEKSERTQEKLKQLHELLLPDKETK